MLNFPILARIHVIQDHLDASSYIYNELILASFLHNFIYVNFSVVCCNIRRAANIVENLSTERMSEHATHTWIYIYTHIKLGVRSNEAI